MSENEGTKKEDRSLQWLVTILALIIGVLLGVAVTAAGNIGKEAGPGPGENGAAAPTPQPMPSIDGILVRIPQACLDAAEDSEKALAGVDEVIDAGRNLDARRLQEALDRLQQLRPGLEAASEKCQEATETGLSEGSIVDPDLTPVPEPSR